MNVTFTCCLDKIIFQGDGGYQVANLENLDENVEIIATGYFSLEANQKYVVSGELVEHYKYGEQLNISEYKISIPTEEEEIVNFLSSSSFEKIGKRTAKKLYDFLGENIIEILKEQPEKALESNIKKEYIYGISEKLNELDGLDIVYQTLSPFEISDYYINEIYQYLRREKIANIKSFLKNKSYELMSIDGFTFKKADSIYLYYDHQKDDDYRLQNMIMDEVRTSCFNSGNTFVDLQKLEKSLDLPLNYIDDILQELIRNKEVELKGKENQKIVFLKDFFQAEKNIAHNIYRRLHYLNLGIDENIIQTEVLKFEKDQKINYSKLQNEAIVNSLKSNISIITGGPGTGKTTIIKALVQIFKDIKYEGKSIKNYSEKIALCAPTGRAAQRLKESTGMETRTIHSLLEWDPYSKKFNKNMDDPLINDLIIIDEFSMVDIFLGEAIFRAILPDAIVVIVGDSAQLESVNPGNVLHDLININDIPLVKLNTIFRQGEGSTIAKIAKEIDEEKQKIELINTEDMSIIDREKDLSDIVVEIINKSYDAGYDDMAVQVLYPKYKGRDGIDSLNRKLLQNKDKTYYEFGNNKYYLFDKVMQLKNNYEKEIYNGDIGRITNIYNTAKSEGLVLEVTFKAKKVNLAKKDLYNLTHAYAISIHKSQGSEFSVVVLPISKESHYMLNKKLIYTAITRATDKLIIVGNINEFYEKIYTKVTERKTYLQEIYKSI